ncbi:MAG: ACT domain-containing protein [Bdellovibrionales bacterium]|nr:ACT domain-containing protein [Bdellovibrionales bacterium]
MGSIPYSQDIPGLLKDMSEVLSSQGAIILNAQVRTTKDLKAVCLFDVTIKDTKHLSEVIAALSKLNGILGVTRITRT